jgi:hypothetical protein
MDALQLGANSQGTSVPSIVISRSLWHICPSVRPSVSTLARACRQTIRQTKVLQRTPARPQTTPPLTPLEHEMTYSL